MNTDPFQARLRWRCRRGMKELDELLLTYLQREFAKAPPAEREAFAAALELPDPQLAAWLLGQSVPEDPPMRALIARLRASAPGA